MANLELLAVLPDGPSRALTGRPSNVRRAAGPDANGLFFRESCRQRCEDLRSVEIALDTLTETCSCIAAVVPAVPRPAAPVPVRTSSRRHGRCCMGVWLRCVPTTCRSIRSAWGLTSQCPLQVPRSDVLFTAMLLFAQAQRPREQQKTLSDGDLSGRC